MDASSHGLPPEPLNPDSGPEEQLFFERVTAYCLNDLSDEERQAFEQQLQTDASLRDEVQAVRATLAAVREWLAAPAPGVERVDELPLPGGIMKKDASLPLSRMNPWTRAARRLAWAALFLMGFVLGLVAQKQASLLDRVTGSYMTAESPAISPGPFFVEDVTPTPAPEPPALASLPQTYQVREENGRVVIETQLKASGANAVWIVDGSFHPTPSALVQ
ncbi:MAG: anti-sigma factor [bacterium]